VLRLLILSTLRFERDPRYCLFFEEPVAKRIGALGMTEPIKQIADPLAASALEMRRHCRQLLIFNAFRKIRHDGRHGIDAAGHVHVTEKVERRQFRP
jgi:hypothetical protein